jgi:hypothetical protein
MYPGSTAAVGVDFIVADTVIAPPEEAVAPLVTAAAAAGGVELHGLLPQAALTLLQLLYPTASDDGGFLPAPAQQRQQHDSTSVSTAAASPRLPLAAHAARHVLGQSFSERLLLLPHAYTAHFYSCAAPVYGGRANETDSGNGVEPPPVGSGGGSGGGGGLMSHACDLARRPQPALPPTRRRLVLASLNAFAKLEPVMFTAWANALRAAPHAVLLLLAGPADVTARVAAEAAARGVHPARLAFAPPRRRDDHVRRYSEQVDAVLDPRLITGHTTTADSLWAGVPTLTLAAGALAGRVSSSFLAASASPLHSGGGFGSAATAGLPLPLLVAHSLTAYERSAAALTTDAEAGAVDGAAAAAAGRPPPPTQPPAYARRLWALHRRAVATSLACPMLNWLASTRDLERGYRAAWEARALGASPGAPPPRLTAPVPAWQQGGLHVVVDADARGVGCLALGGAATAAADGSAGAPSSPVADRARAVFARRVAYEREAAALLAVAGFHAGAAACAERLRVAGAPALAAGSSSGG